MTGVAARSEAAPSGMAAVGARHPLRLIAAGCLFYAVGPVFVRASSVSGPVFSLWRLWFGVAVIAVLAAGHFRVTRSTPSRAGLRWALASGAAFGVHQLLFMTAVKHTSVVDVLLVGTLAPVVTAAAAVPMFGERTGVPFRLWTLLAIGGAGGVVLAGSSGPDGEPLGMTLALLNVFAFSAFFLTSKGGREHIDTTPFLLCVMVVAAVFVTAFVALTEGGGGSPSGDDLLLALATAVVPGTLGHFVMTWPLKWVPANVPPVMRLSIPFLSGAMAWVVLGEGFTWAHVVAGAVTIAGVAGALTSPSGRRLVAREAVPVSGGDA